MAKSQVTWKKRILIPFWCVRIFFMVVLIGFYAWALNYVRTHEDFKTVSVGVAILFMLLLVICLLLDILAIVMFARGALKPGTFLTFNLVQTTIWFIILILDIVAIARKGVNRSGLIGSFIVFFSFLGLLIYAVINFVKDRKNRKPGHGENPTANPASVPLVQPHQTQYAGDYTHPESMSHSVPHPQHYGYTAAPSMGAAPYKPAHMPVELPTKQGAATEYYSGAAVQPGSGHAPANPFADPPAYGQKH